jgi:hypothetical protein
MEKIKNYKVITTYGKKESEKIYYIKMVLDFLMK